MKVDAPEGVLPTQEHTIKGKSGKKLLDVELSNDVSPTWAEMEKVSFLSLRTKRQADCQLVNKGLVKNIGISNFNIRRTRELLKFAKIKPVANQVELSIQCPQPELVAYLEKNDILPQAYSPLGGTDGQKLRENPAIVKIAEKHGVQGATVLVSWLIKRGICVLPKSVTPSRIEANAKSESPTGVMPRPQLIISR